MKLIKSISAVLLAVLVLMASTSFVVGLHRCMGEIRSIALFSKAEVCEMEKMQPPCHKHLKAPCCEDESIIHESTSFKASLAHIQISAPDAVEVSQPLILLSEIIPSAPAAINHELNYDPPLPSSDRIVELQVFLI